MLQQTFANKHREVIILSLSLHPHVCMASPWLETGPIGKGWGVFLFGLNKNPPPSLRWAGGGGEKKKGGEGGGVM